MKDKHDHSTLELLPSEKASRGRPKKDGALTPAERAKRYRERKKQRLDELKDESKPMRSDVIDLSEIPTWRR